jgi:integrase
MKKVVDLFDEYLTHRAKEGNCRKTIDEHNRFLKGPITDAIGYKDLKDLSILDRADLIEAGKKYGIHGSQRAVVYFRQLMQYAKIAGYKINFDWRDVKVPKVPQKRVEYLDASELRRIRECFDLTEEAGLRTRALIEFMLGTGLRIGEACSINKEHINPDTKELWFVNVKTGEEETVILNDNVLEWLNLYLSKRKDDHPALFVSGRGRLLPVTSRNYIRTRTKHLGLNKRVAHHVFRRTCGTYLLQDKVDLQSVRDYLRHKSERTTLRYYIGVDKEMRRNIAQNVMGKFVVRPI